MCYSIIWTVTAKIQLTMKQHGSDFKLVCSILEYRIHQSKTTSRADGNVWELEGNDCVAQ